MRKFLFVPHCLRNAQSCKAEVAETGYVCKLCGACKIGTLVTDAIANGFAVFIVPGGSLVKRIFSQQQITDEDLVIGIACETELRDLKENFISFKFKAKNKIPVKLDKDGCINTDIDLKKLSEYFPLKSK